MNMLTDVLKAAKESATSAVGSAKQALEQGNWTSLPQWMRSKNKGVLLHQGAKEKARRVSQMARGFIREENRGRVNVAPEG